MRPIAAHVADRHSVGTGRKIGLFWIETNTNLFRQHMHRFHYHAQEHPNALLHCSADTSVLQRRIGGDVPLVWDLGNGQVERMNFAFVYV